MASTNFCHFSITRYYSTNSWKLICSNGHSYTCSTHEYSPLRLRSYNTLTDRFRIIRKIIKSVNTLWSQINYLVSEISQICENGISKWESSVVTSKGNYHSFLYLLSSPSIYPIIGSQRIHTKYIGSKSHKDTKLNIDAKGEARSQKWRKSEVAIAIMSHLFTLKSKAFRRPQLNERSIWYTTDVVTARVCASMRLML